MQRSISPGMFTVSAEYVPSTALVTCTGKACVAEMCAALAFGGEFARRGGHSSFLFDLLAVDFEGGTADRQEMGRYASTQLQGVKRMAVVLPPALDTGEGAQAARQGGLDLRNFHTLAEGLDWLTSPTG